MSTNGVPPPMTIVSYVLEYRGNCVYRVESAEVLGAMPLLRDQPLELLAGVAHLNDALEVLGICRSGQWVGCFAASGRSEAFNDNDPSVRVVAWTIH